MYYELRASTSRKTNKNKIEVKTKLFYTRVIVHRKMYISHTF